MDIYRRQLITAGTIAGATVAATAGALPAAAAVRRRPSGAVRVEPTAADTDASRLLQSAIDRGRDLGLPVELAPGRYSIGQFVSLHPQSKLLAEHGLAVIVCAGDGAITASGAPAITLRGLRIEGGRGASGRATAATLIAFDSCPDIDLCDLVVRYAPQTAIQLWRSSGRIQRSTITATGHTAINAGDSAGLDISGNRIVNAGNNGIVVWRETVGPDHTTVTGNHITHIRSDAGGSGQNGNAINAFRAGHVLIAQNTIHDCAYSAVRCNAASNAQIVANTCRGIGEVALYAEFAFEGAVIANNIVDGAATGISVTNFQEGGRLATVQGNLVRNLFRREHEPVDKRGIGIGVEADTVVSANTIENAPTAGIAIGWGPWMRNVAVTGNIVRGAAVGMSVSRHADRASVLIANNIIDGSRNGAVRLADHNAIVGAPLKNGATEAPALLQGNLLS